MIHRPRHDERPHHPPAARGRCCEVHYRISAPPFAHPCYFGTDIPDEKDLIATGHTVEEINELVGSDTLGY